MQHLILRHSRLADPYNSYESLTFDQLADLSDGSFCPAIDTDFVKKQAEKVVPFCAQDQSVMICASSVDRAQQTATVLGESLSKNTSVTIETLPFSHEIEFDLRRLFPGEKNVHLGHLRVAILEHLVNGSDGIERLSSVFDRAVRMKNHVEQQQQRTIYITHGFFMRVLQRVIEGATLKELTLPSLLDAWRHDYLKGYTVQNKHLERYFSDIKYQPTCV